MSVLFGYLYFIGTQATNSTQEKAFELVPPVFTDFDEPFFCKTCHVDCTSESGLLSHQKGKKHIRILAQLGIVFYINQMIFFMNAYGQHWFSDNFWVKILI